MTRFTLDNMKIIRMSKDPEGKIIMEVQNGGKAGHTR